MRAKRKQADKKSDKKPGGHERRGSDLWAMAKKLGGHGTASGSSGGDDSRADDSHLPRPERIFACLDARRTLTHLLPQIVRTHGVESAVAREWNAAIVKATEGAHAASASLAPTVRREGGRLRLWANALAANAGIEPVTSETRVFAVTVSTFCAALAKRPDARAVLFGGGDSTEVEVGYPGSPGLGAPVHVQPAPVGIIEGLSPPQADRIDREARQRLGLFRLRRYPRLHRQRCRRRGHGYESFRRHKHTGVPWGVPSQTTQL